MANSKEIRNQIASIGNTQKITSAMEKVAASKMKKTQERIIMQITGASYNAKTRRCPSETLPAGINFPGPFFFLVIIL